MNRPVLFLLLFFFPLSTWAKNPPVNEKALKAFQDSLLKLDSAIFIGNDQAKLTANLKFARTLEKALNTEGAFDFPFDSLKTIGVLTAPDKAFRIFNWNMPKDDGTYLYFGFLMVNESKVKQNKSRMQKDRYVIYELVDHSADIRNPELSRLSPEKWYGALYYDIIRTTDKSDVYYTLLGWDGNTPMTWKKIIDVVSFDRNGLPVFGDKQLFHRGKRSSNRVIFEFRAELVMTLKYEKDNNRIVFDHLAPEVSGAEGMYQFYSQTFSYDAFVWKKGKWMQVDDVPVTNESNPKDKHWNNPKAGQRAPGQATDPNAQRKRGWFYRATHKRMPTSGAG
jgi:hypothetical protein